jgi:hypothetical protein
MQTGHLVDIDTRQESATVPVKEINDAPISQANKRPLYFPPRRLQGYLPLNGVCPANFLVLNEVINDYSG